MELLKRYSKPDYQGRRLRRMVDLAEKSAKTQVRETTPLPQPQRVDRRLPAETIAELVQAYHDGISTPELRRRYNLSQGSVIKILHEHDVTMRGQGLVDRDVATAAELYRNGTTLAQLGEQFGISPNAVRRALVSAGVVMRARGGSKPRHSPVGGLVLFTFRLLPLFGHQNQGTDQLAVVRWAFEYTANLNDGIR